MKAKIICTVTIEYEIDLGNYMNCEQALQADLEQFREDYDVFYEIASVNDSERIEFEGELLP